MMPSMVAILISFLSTLSLRRATNGHETAPYTVGISIHALLAESDLALIRYLINTYHNFYPRSPCGERLKFVNLRVLDGSISIHALLAESDLRVLDGSKSSIEISIHALLAESDSASDITCAFGRDFYPRSPCGERRDHANYHPLESGFLSTLSLRRATRKGLAMR